MVGSCKHTIGSLLGIKRRGISYLAIRGVLDPSYIAAALAKFGVHADNMEFNTQNEE